MSDRGQSAHAALTAGALFAVGALLAIIALPLPGDSSNVLLAVVGLADTVAALLCVFLPWDRWSHRATLWIVPIGLVITGLSSGGGLVPPRA
jgi:hypothetical protein